MFEDGVPKAEPVCAAPKATGAAAAPKGFGAVAGVLLAPPKLNDGLGGSVADFPNAKGVDWAVVVGLEAPKEKDAPEDAAVVVAVVAPKEKEEATAPGTVVDPKAGAPTTDEAESIVAAVVVAGLEPNVNRPEPVEAVVAVAAAAAPKLNGVTAATEAVVVTVEDDPKEGGAVEVAEAAPKLKRPAPTAGA